MDLRRHVVVIGAAALIALALGNTVFGCIVRNTRTDMECRTLGYQRGSYVPGSGIEVCTPHPVALAKAREMAQ
jgi:hypothetical protein